MASAPPSPVPQSLRPPLDDLLQTNLRLLDLDRRVDYPLFTFSTRDAKARIKCTEWILFRLFELWDPDETRDRLSPFFPPLEPLQSLNLRNALYRSLNELKKNGVLGRETILRKTMLDECKGDKLLELLVAFSTTVVKKVVVPRYAGNKRNARPTQALKLAMSPMLDAASQGSLIPLAIAHRASLGTLLRQKAERKARSAQFNSLMDQKLNELDRRSRACNNAPPPSFSAAEAAFIKSEVRANWMGGNSKWPHTLLYGDDTKAGDAPLAKPFNEIWAVVVQGGTLTAHSDNLGLVENLERRVRSQAARLNKWKEFQRDLAQSAITTNFHTVSGASHDEGSLFDFARHRRVRLGRPADDEPRARAPVQSTKYQDIVQEMQQALAFATISKRTRPVLDPIQQAVDPAPQSRPEPPTTGHLRSFSLTSRFQPKLGPEPKLPPPTTADVPLSSVFSPPKPVTNGAGQPRRIFRASTQLQLQLGSNSSWEPTLASSKDPSPLRSPETAESVSSTLSGSPSDDTTLVSTSQNGDDPSQHAADAIISSVLSAPETPAPATISNRMSLTERTRMSIMRTQAPFVKELHPVRESSKETHSATNLIGNAPSVADRRASLLERTQQSMLASAQAHANGERQRTKRMSINVHKRQSMNVFPVNQFETPGRPRPEPKRDATPTERLFSQDAEYSSVFKSRPRIKLSPIPTPEGHISEEFESPAMANDVDGEAADDGNVDDSFMQSSPLRGRG